MLINSIGDFVKCIPTAAGTEWSAIAPYVQEAEASIKTTLTGTSLFSHIEALQADALLKYSLTSLIAITAYLNAIPFMDLVQTKTGFGVVNNSNVSPASRERVERLILWCEKSIDRTTDLLIINTLQNNAALAEWTKFNGFNDLTNCLINTGIDFEGYFKQSDMKRKSFLDYKNDLITCQNKVLALTFGNPVINELINQIRTNTLTESNKSVLRNMKHVLGDYANGIRGEELAAKSNSFRMIYEGLKDNPTYNQSPEAIVRLPASNYENKKSDSTFFFG